MNTYDMATCINLGLDHLLSKDANVMLLGEDIGVNGGVFRITDKLLEKYGPIRVLDTPLAENMLAGMALGMSTQGLYPIVEFQFMAFIYPALEQIISHIAKMRMRTLGHITCPMLLRTPYGCGVFAPEHHSESSESIFASIPGIRVVVPSTPTRAFELIIAAHNTKDPVLFLEPTAMYRAVKQPFSAHKNPVKIDKAIVEQLGNDLTIIAWGACMRDARALTEQLQQHGLTIDLIDLVSLKPIDLTTIYTSVKKTKKCVIIQEAPKTMSIAHDISANLHTTLWSELTLPTLCLCGFDSGVPYPQHESFYKRNVKKLKQEILQWIQ